MRQAILNLISQENQAVSSAVSFEEKSLRINNIIQLKINSGFADIAIDIYVDVKNFIVYYIKSLKEKQFNYDEFNEAHIIDLITKFNIEQQHSLLEHVLREAKNEHFTEKVGTFEALLHKTEFLKEWQKLSWNNLVKVIFTASIYSTWTIALSLLFCFVFCFILYLPAPDWCIPLFTIKYHKVSENFLLNHGCNVLMSFFDIQSDKFVLPINVFAAILIISIKVFFISIVINVLLDQFKSRFKI